MRIAPYFILAPLAVTGCTTTNPGNGARVSYHLPRTDVEATLVVTVEDCGDDANPRPVLSSILSFEPKVSADEPLYLLDGALLASRNVKRTLSIKTNEEQILTGINAENTDRSPEILGNVLKFAATAAQMIIPALDLSNQTPHARCNKKTNAIMKRVKAIDKLVAGLRKELANRTEGPTPADRQKAKDIYLLMLERAPLTALLTTTTKITFPLPRDGLTRDSINPGSYKLEAPINPAVFDDLFWEDKTNKANKESRQDALDQVINFAWWVKPNAPRVPIPLTATKERKTLGSCKLSMKVPSPVVLTVIGKQTKGGDAQKELSFPAAQWADPADLCLSVGFGESRSVALSFDKFGRTSEFTWSSNARAEAVTGALAGYAETAAPLRPLAFPTGEEKMKSEADALELKQKLDKLKACEMALANGGKCEE